ncbi:MAG: hypothetical protein JWM30_3030 [Burkholderia sp.]|jgi:uncharacterized protein YciI|nr:hypothetical protein [Burkholderia sp.]
MRWIVLFEDAPAMQEVRQHYEADHLAYLRANAAEILIAGGLREGPDAAFSGGLWVLDVTSRERACELAEQDPYFVHGRRPYRVLQWGKALPDVEARL